MHAGTWRAHYSPPMIRCIRTWEVVMYIASEFGRRDAQARECVVSIGVFDGVHCGHGRVLGALREAGARHALPTVVVTFDPHPRLVLQPHRTVPMLVSLRHRLSLLTATGNVDRCV